MMNNTGAGTLVPSESEAKYGAGTLVPSSSIGKNGTKVPTPEGYRQTKVGVIPEDWDTPRIDTVLQRIRKKVDVDKTVKYRQIGIRSHAKGIFHKEAVTGEALGNKSVFWIEEDCFIVNIVFAWEQAVAKTTNNEKGMIASHRFPMYQPKDNKSDVDYILYFFKSKRGKHLLGLASPGGAGRNKTLGQGEFSELIIPLPPLEEQQKIAQILTTWDDAITKQEALIKAKEELKKGLMQKLLSGEVRFGEFGVGTLVPSNSIEKNGTKVPTPRAERNNGTEAPAPDGWKEVRLGDKFDFIKTYSNSRKDLSNIGEIEYLHYGDIHTKYKYHLDLNKNTLPKISQNKFKSNIEYVLNGDLLIADASEDYADIGKSVEVVNLKNRKVVSGLHTFLLRDKNNNFADGYKGLILYNQKVAKEIKKIATGISVLGISKTNLSKLKILLPPKQEQQKIAKVLTLADKEIDLLKNELEALKEQKRGLMQKLLTGEVRVRV